MAHFAELDENNVVIRVIVGIDEEQGDGETLYQEETGKVWKKTSFNTMAGQHRLNGIPFRKNYAGINYTFRDDLNIPEGAFVPPQNFPSWVLNEETCQWEAPTPQPDNSKAWYWDEEQLQWVEMQ